MRLVDVTPTLGLSALYSFAGQICDEMGYRGRTHDVYLSECDVASSSIPGGSSDSQGWFSADLPHIPLLF